MAKKRQLTREERGQWDALIKRADAIWRLSPWGWCRTGDCFGIHPAGLDEPFFAAFCEGVGEGGDAGIRVVRYLRGWRALFDFMVQAHSPTKSVATWLMEIPMLEMLFLPPELLFPHEGILYGELGAPSYGPKKLRPVFRSVVPGYHPWLPDGEERALLDTLVYQTLGMMLRLEGGREALSAGGPGHLLVLTQDASGAWSDAYPPARLFSDEGVEVCLTAGLLRRLSRQPLRDADVQIDLHFLPVVPGFSAAMPGDEILAKSLDGRPGTLFCLIVADTKTGEVQHTGALRASDGIAAMWGAVPEMLVDLFEKTGGCPSVIEVTGDRMANLMHSLEAYLPFKLVRRGKLDMVEGMAGRLGAKLLARLARGGGKPAEE